MQGKFIYFGALALLAVASVNAETLGQEAELHSRFDDEYSWYDWNSAGHGSGSNWMDFSGLEWNNNYLQQCHGGPDYPDGQYNQPASAQGQLAGEGNGACSCAQAPNQWYYSGDQYVSYDSGDDSWIEEPYEKAEDVEFVDSDNPWTFYYSEVELEDGNASGEMMPLENDANKGNKAIEGKPVKVEGKPVKVMSKPIKEMGKPVKAEGKPVKVMGKPVKIMEKRVRVMGKPVKIMARPVKAEGRPVKAEGKPVKAEGKPVKIMGKPVKVEGKPVKIMGKPLLIDGNPVKVIRRPLKVVKKRVNVLGNPIKVMGKPVIKAKEAVFVDENGQIARGFNYPRAYSRRYGVRAASCIICPNYLPQCSCPSGFRCVILPRSCYRCQRSVCIGEI